MHSSPVGGREGRNKVGEKLILNLPSPVGGGKYIYGFLINGINISLSVLYYHNHPEGGNNGKGIFI